LIDRPDRPLKLSLGAVASFCDEGVRKTGETCPIVPFCRSGRRVIQLVDAGYLQEIVVVPERHLPDMTVANALNRWRIDSLLTPGWFRRRPLQRMLFTRPASSPPCRQPPDRHDDCDGIAARNRLGRRVSLSSISISRRCLGAFARASIRSDGRPRFIGDGRLACC
jgi:hypothetical protein